ncbi:MAG TPA: hypothetical protein PLU41_13725 [Acidobacteriota bacterium]|nr:hypothetical protein [Acidobacteriota bacterium]
MNKDTHQTDKQAYDKPRLRVIELLAEEVLAIGCKRNASDYGSGTNLCLNGVCKATPGS